MKEATQVNSKFEISVHVYFFQTEVLLFNTSKTESVKPAYNKCVRSVTLIPNLHVVSVKQVTHTGNLFHTY